MVSRAETNVIERVIRWTMEQLQKKDSRDRMQKYKIKVHNSLNTGNEKQAKLTWRQLATKQNFGTNQSKRNKIFYCHWEKTGAKHLNQ